MTEVLFYHLQQQPLEAVLPILLGRTRERGWRALVRVGSPDRMAALDEHLWSYSDESFLPHGSTAEPEAEWADQPVLLTTRDGNPNGAAMLFCVDGVPVPPSLDEFARVALMLDGRDEAALAAGRATWKALKAAGHTMTYWQQDESGRWSKKAG